MLRRVLGEDVELVTALTPGLRSVRADPGQIERVILNIAVNAREAMPRGGTLKIETAAMQLGEDSASYNGRIKSGEYVLLSMADTGIGMDERVLSHVFEPFFTTKEHGTGLGLSTSYGIVRQSGGDIWATSKTGCGTTFHVCLPAVERTPDGEQSATHPESLSGTETILLVEDDDGVRHVVETMLKRNGYQVLSSCSASEAMAVAERHVSPIDLLITDVVMPGESGRKVAQGILARRPKMKVLFISGYGESTESGTDGAFLQKPFTSDELALKIREVLRAG